MSILNKISLGRNYDKIRECRLKWSRYVFSGPHAAVYKCENLLSRGSRGVEEHLSILAKR